ncbi:MAG TPA: short-chain dehydrogenase, partial [Duganella sp.]|nr:short-chain dehydrogenase [Duganella sp.]
MANTENRADAGTASQQRDIQQRQDQADERAKQEQAGGQPGQRQGPVQTTDHAYPGTMPSQHLAKPGLEAQMQLKPEFLAPDYAGSGKLAGMV